MGLRRRSCGKKPRIKGKETTNYTNFHELKLLASEQKSSDKTTSFNSRQKEMAPCALNGILATLKTIRANSCNSWLKKVVISVSKKTTDFWSA